MSISHDPYVAPQPSGSEHPDGAKDTAQQQAQRVAGTTKEQASTVVDTTKQQVGAVTADLRDQTRQLTQEARDQLIDHASDQRDRAAANLRSIGDELREMASGSATSGLGAQLVRQGGDLSYRAADFLGEREPSQLLDEVRSLARRRPGAFLLGAVVAGVVVGRATRSVASAHKSDTGSDAAAPGNLSATPPAVDTAYAVPELPMTEPVVTETMVVDPAAWDPQPANPGSGVPQSGINP